MYSIVLSGVLVLLIVIYLGRGETLEVTSRTGINAVTNFETCKANGYPLIALYPEQCKGPNGIIFINLKEELATTTLTSTIVKQKNLKP